MAYTPTIGIEVHAELATRTKMFCDSKNDPDEKRPNVNVCPVCMAHPGTLPVINKQAVGHVLKVGSAIGAELADYTEFDRKNYFYPDLPKGYQISQYAHPLVSGGELAGVRITRVHLEEDTARSFHKGNWSYVDFNRAGVPLMELVTEPVIRTAAEAYAFAKELQLLLRYLGASGANMEKGQMRVEANVSLSSSGKLGTKVEVKNLNSFKAVRHAIKHEIRRQEEILKKGENVTQETRGWDENKGETFPQRMKESSHDYRYFPDPDLPSLRLREIPEFSPSALSRTLPELPWERRARLRERYGFHEKIVEMYVVDDALGRFFEDVAGDIGDDKEKIKLASNYITSDLVNLLSNSPDAAVVGLKFSVRDFTRLVMLAAAGVVSSRGAKDILSELFARGGDPEAIAREKNLIQVSGEDALRGVAEKIIREHPQVAADFRAGKEQLLQFLVGQGMKETKGAANPAVLQKVLKELLA